MNVPILSCVISDLAETFGQKIAPYVLDNWFDTLLKQVRMDRHASKATKSTARWAKDMVKLHCL